MGASNITYRLRNCLMKIQFVVSSFMTGVMRRIKSLWVKDRSGDSLSMWTTLEHALPIVSMIETKMMSILWTHKVSHHVFSVHFLIASRAMYNVGVWLRRAPTLQGPHLGVKSLTSSCSCPHIHLWQILPPKTIQGIQQVILSTHGPLELQPLSGKQEGCPSLYLYHHHHVRSRTWYEWCILEQRAP